MEFNLISKKRYVRYESKCIADGCSIFGEYVLHKDHTKIEFICNNHKTDDHIHIENYQTRVAKKYVAEIILYHWENLSFDMYILRNIIDHQCDLEFDKADFYLMLDTRRMFDILLFMKVGWNSLFGGLYNVPNAYWFCFPDVFQFFNICVDFKRALNIIKEKKLVNSLTIDSMEQLIVIADLIINAYSCHNSIEYIKNVNYVVPSVCIDKYKDLIKSKLEFFYN